MTMLDPDDPKDRRITSFTRSYPIKEIHDVWIQQGTFSYDCWGRKQGGLFKETVSPALSKEMTGQRSFLTLKLMQRGCCPPQLMKGFIEQEGMPADEKDPVEEAMKLHARGYFGGGG